MGGKYVALCLEDAKLIRTLQIDGFALAWNSCLPGSTCGTVVKIWNGNKTLRKTKRCFGVGVGVGSVSNPSTHPPRQSRYNFSCTEYKWISL